MADKNNSSSIYKGFFQAAGIALYCSLIGTIFFNAERLFGQMSNLAGPITFLLLFSVSVLTCALIVFYQPYKIFFDGKKKEAVNLVLYTTGWIFVFFVVFLLVAAIH